MLGFPRVRHLSPPNEGFLIRHRLLRCLDAKVFDLPFVRMESQKPGLDHFEHLLSGHELVQWIGHNDFIRP